MYKYKLTFIYIVYAKGTIRVHKYNIIYIYIYIYIYILNQTFDLIISDFYLLIDLLLLIEHFVTCANASQYNIIIHAYNIDISM